MADYVKGIKTQNGTVLIDYNSLANKPEVDFTTKEKEKLASISSGATNTPIVNDLSSDSESSALSAKQGAELKKLIDNKQDKVTGAATTITKNKLAANSVLISDGSGNVAASGTITNAELESLYGISGNIQSQLNSKASADHTHAAGSIGQNDLPLVPMWKGGTEATDGASGLKNLFAAGATILSQHQYGTQFPDPSIPGRIFFKKV